MYNETSLRVRRSRTWQSRARLLRRPSIISGLLAMTGMVIFVLPAFAGEQGIGQDIKQSLIGFGTKLFGQAPRIERTSIAFTIGVFLQWFLAVNGLAFLILMLYAGNKWMGAAGNDEMVETAKKTLVRAIIGFIVCVAGFALIQGVGLIITGAGLGQ